ncbi:MAG: hypothetical protein MK202_01955 [Tenacibaculum sp.]|nr:hypothetical protein [Tenacibaculum sp.]
MKSTTEIEVNKYEKPIRELVGMSIVNVNYYEIDYGKPMWNEIDYHSLDYGIELVTSDKSKFYFVWGNNYTQYDLIFRKGNILTEFSKENGVKKHIVTNNQKWTELIGAKINGIESYWSYWSLINDGKPNYYPQDVRVEFENGKEIWISALEIRDGNINRMIDNLTVVFDKKTAKKYKIGIKNEV